MRIYFTLGLIGLSTIAPVYAEESDSFLGTRGTQICDNHGNGKEIQLRGVNVGGLLEWQNWMCPIDSSSTLPDLNPGHNGYDYEVRHLLKSRFGAAKAEELINCYEDSWFNEGDLDNVKLLNMNVIRLPIAYDTLANDDGTFRPDGFKRIDSIISKAWSRGIYTILDFHAFLPPTTNQDGSSSGFWSQPNLADGTVAVWAHIAEHFKGNPAIAMFDLLNEPNNSAPKGLKEPPAGIVMELYKRIYRAIRIYDTEHIIAMEGMWDWHSLSDPHREEFTNVVYSFHFYHFGAEAIDANNDQTISDLASLKQMQNQWKIPALIGEFNFFGDPQAWEYGINAYETSRENWVMWGYKNKASGACSWGLYNLTEGKTPPETPNLVTDSENEIQRKWKGWSTAKSFSLNPMLGPILTQKLK